MSLNESVNRLLSYPPYGPRDDSALLSALAELTAYHQAGCPEYARISPPGGTYSDLAALPFLHVGLFKQLEFRTCAPEIRHERTLLSSATTSGQSSRICLDQISNRLQGISTAAVLRSFLGEGKRPLVILDSARSLGHRGVISARVAAALSLQTLASEIHFLLDDADNPTSVRWASLIGLLAKNESLLVYGFTHVLWTAWAGRELSAEVRETLRGRHIDFVHSGGWKRLEEIEVSRHVLENSILQGLAPSSRVLDFYGLVEQAGVIYPLCEKGYRHVPIWASVLVRDPYSLESKIGEVGQLQLMNLLAWGAPYHNVLTEDLGRIIPGECECGRSGPRFELVGRVPRAELRGCANI